MTEQDKVVTQEDWASVLNNTATICRQFAAEAQTDYVEVGCAFLDRIANMMDKSATALRDERAQGCAEGIESAALICEHDESPGSDWGDACIACAADIRAAKEALP